MQVPCMLNTTNLATKRLWLGELFNCVMSTLLMTEKSLLKYLYTKSMISTKDQLPLEVQMRNDCTRCAQERWMTCIYKMVDTIISYVAWVVTCKLHTTRGIYKLYVISAERSGSSMFGVGIFDRYRFSHADFPSTGL